MPVNPKKVGNAAMSVPDAAQPRTADSNDAKTTLQQRYASVLSEPVPPRLRALNERLKIVERNTKR